MTFQEKINSIVAHGPASFVTGIEQTFNIVIPEPFRQRIIDEYTTPQNIVDRIVQEFPSILT